MTTIPPTPEEIEARREAFSLATQMWWEKFSHVLEILPLEERYARWRPTPRQSQLFRGLEALCDEWMDKQQTRVLCWAGGKCAIDDAGMALLIYTANRPAIGMRMCFWGRNPDDPRILKQLDDAAKALSIHLARP